MQAEHNLQNHIRARLKKLGVPNAKGEKLLRMITKLPEMFL